MRRIAAVHWFLAVMLVLSACSDSAMNNTISPPYDDFLMNSAQQPGDNTVPDFAETDCCPVELKHEDSLLRFLTEVNFNGKIEHSADEPAPPGTPSEVCFIPQPKQDLVGKTVSIIFEPDWEESYVSFHYIYNWRTGEERLIIILAPDEINIPMLIVFKTQVGGAQALLENLKTETSFEAEILAMVNIDYQEGNVYARNAARSTYGISECEIIDMQNFMSLAGQEYLGVCGGTSEGIFVKGICGEAISKGLQDDLDVFWQIYERFSLTELLLITSVR